MNIHSSSPSLLSLSFIAMDSLTLPHSFSLFYLDRSTSNAFPVHSIWIPHLHVHFHRFLQHLPHSPERGTPTRIAMSCSRTSSRTTSTSIYPAGWRGPPLFLLHSNSRIGCIPRVHDSFLAQPLLSWSLITYSSYAVQLSTIPQSIGELLTKARAYYLAESPS